ncbi:MAG: helix-turn-helix domain-containing protein [Bordetella sp.]|nr:helix-turn-helix domain-containing protein [Bordetella sp.]
MAPRFQPWGAFVERRVYKTGTTRPNGASGRGETQYGYMPNIASVLKTEIARVARKEVRGETESLKKASTQHRAAIAQLRREMADLHKALKQAQRAAGTVVRAGARPAPGGNAPAAEGGDGTPRRFSASRLAAHRAKLGLSAAEYGRLVGMSGATIYNWEQGKSRPDPQQVQLLGALKLQSPTAIRARLAEMG